MEPQEGASVAEFAAVSTVGRRDPRLLAFTLGLFIAAAVYFVYRGTFEFKLLTWDDDQHVSDNQYFQPLTWRSFTHFWVYSYIYLYVPISYNFYGLEVAVANWFPSPEPSERLNPAIFHIGNVLVHLAGTLLAYRLYLKLVKNAPAACCGALLYALHPFQAECVSWVGEARGLLCTLFCFASLWFYLKYAGVDPERGIFAVRPFEPRPERRRDYVLGSMCYAAALLSKPSAAAWPLIVMTIDVLLLRRPWRTSLVRMVPWLIAAAAVTALTKYYQKTAIMYGPAVMPLWQRPFVAGDAYAFYLLKLVWPFEMAFDYGRMPHIAAASPWFYRAWLLPTLIAAVFASLPRRRVWLACYAVFLFAIAPVSGIVPFLYQSISTVADRYMAIPLFGFGLMSAALLAVSRARIALIIALAPLLGFWAHRTMEQCATWRDDWTLYRHAIAVNPDSYMANLNLGYRYRLDKQYGLALRHYERVTQLRSDYLWAYYNRGLSFVALDRVDDAIAEYRKALKIDPNVTEMLIALGDALALKKDFEAAEEQYRRAVRASFPTEHLPFVILGEFLYRRGRIDEADAAFVEARDRQPYLEEIDRRQGHVLLEIGRYRDAAPMLERVVSSDPRSLEARIDLANCYYSLSKFALAAEQAAAAIRLDGASFAAHHNLALAAAASGKTSDARREFEAALRLVPPAGRDAEEIRKALAALR